MDYLVWVGVDGTPTRYTNKVSTVEGWSARGVAKIPIVTTQQFIDIMGGV